MNNGIERGLAIAEALKKFISNKFVCEIGCDNGDILHGLSKYAKKAIGIESESLNISAAKQLEYKCDTTIVHADAYSFLKENTHINPNVFYFWANYRKKNEWDAMVGGKNSRIAWNNQSSDHCWYKFSA